MRVNVSGVSTGMLFAAVLTLTIAFFVLVVFYTWTEAARRQYWWLAALTGALFVLSEALDRGDRDSAVFGILLVGLWDLTLLGFGRLPRDLPGRGDRGFTTYPAREKVRRWGILFTGVFVADLVAASVVYHTLVKV